jgi:DGQHR domain-containing protein
MTEKSPNRLRYSVSLVTQGSHRFYTLTMPSEVLGRTCFVTTRAENPKQGFQRVLDQDRAKQIADYIDSGFGTIPSSIVLSAQPEAALKIIGAGKTIEFEDMPHAFLVLDGQHRVYGFSLARTSLRVPVVIYNGLSRQDETRLFIDINTKQRPVPNELLLDIKKLADYENDQEKLLSQIYDSFADQPNSPLMGLMTPAARSAGKISRVTFYAALKPLLPIFSAADPADIYEATRAYLQAIIEGTRARELEPNITNPTVFRAVIQLFPEVARRVKDRFAADYTAPNFSEVLAPMFERLKANTFKNPGTSHKALSDVLLKALQTNFIL